MSGGIDVVATGPLATLQDLGRPGYARLGVSPSGAADPPSLRLANRLLGNAEGAAAVEVTFGGLALHTRRAVWVAVTGAPAPVTAGGRTAPVNAPLYLPAGARLRLAPPAVGVRSYVAVRGGFDVPAVLGSRSTDTLGGIGPAPLHPGQSLPVGARPDREPCVDVAPVPPIPAEPVLPLWPGPRWEWLTADARAAIAGQAWRVAADSNRIGVRLAGDRLPPPHRPPVPSEGIVAGAVQLPPDGQPIVFLADHPVTGGYPVVAVVPAAALATLAQCRPGQSLRLRWRPHPGAPVR